MTTQLSIKTDPSTKKTAQKKAEAQGLTLTTVINAFLRKYSEGEFEFIFIKKEEPDITLDVLFQSKKIVKQANRIARYLSHHDL